MWVHERSTAARLILEHHVAPGARPSLPWLAGLSLASLVVVQLPTFLTGAVGVQLQRELGFGPTALGAAIASSLVMSFLGSVALGRLVQRQGWNTGMRFATGLAAASMAGIAWLTTSWLSLAMLLMLGGVAKAAGHPAANLAIATVAPPGRQGLLFGVKQAGVPAAAMLGGLSVPILVIDHGWRAAFAVSAIVAVAVTLGVPGGTGTATGRDPRLISASRPESGRMALVVLAVAAGAGVAVSNSVAGFLTTYAVQIGIDEGTAGLLLAAASFTGLAVRVLLGWMADKANLGLGTVAALLGGGAVGVGLLTTQSPSLVAIGAMLAFGAGWAWAGIFNLAIVSRNPSTPAIATGYTQAGVYAGAALGPFAFGMLVDTAGFVIGWWAIAMIGLVAAFTMWAASRSALRNTAPIIE